MTIAFPPLPYAEDALAPHISADTLATHHGKHHKAYVDKTNAAIEGTDLAGMSLEDVPAILEIIQEIKALRNRTILLVEHKFDMIMAVSDSITVLQEGRIICDDTPEAVSNNEDVLKAYLGGGVKNE